MKSYPSSADYLNAFSRYRTGEFLGSAIEALESLKRKELGRVKLYSDGLYCAVGAICKHMMPTFNRSTYLDSYTIASIFNVNHLVIRRLMDFNDKRVDLNGEPETPSERYDRVLGWIRCVIEDPSMALPLGGDTIQ